MDQDRPDVRAAIVALEQALVEHHEGSPEAVEARIAEAIALLHPGEVVVEWDGDAA